MSDENGNFMEITLNDKHGAGVHTHRVENIRVYADKDDHLIADKVGEGDASIVFEADRLLGVTTVFNWGN